MTILGLSGSLRAGSYNRALLRAAQELAPAGVSIELCEIGRLPHYDADIDAAGDQAEVEAFKDAIRAADGILIATPEYNRGIPGVLKNAVDWASRPPIASPLTGKRVALMGASTGQGGTRRAQEQLRQVLAAPGADVLDEPHVFVASAYEQFDSDGRLVRQETRESIRALVEALAAEIAVPAVSPDELVAA